jgi:hypothetical protein
MPPKAALTVASAVKNYKKIQPKSGSSGQSYHQQGHFQKSGVTCANTAITKGQTHQGNYMSGF